MNHPAMLGVLDCALQRPVCRIREGLIEAQKAAIAKRCRRPIPSFAKGQGSSESGLWS
jgi:hypothetical protein